MMHFVILVTYKLLKSFRLMNLTFQRFFDWSEYVKIERKY